MQESYATQLTPNQTRLQNPIVKKWMVIAGIVTILVLTGLFIWGVFWVAVNHPETIEALRDVMMIALALGSCFFGIALIIMTVMVIRLVNLLEFEIKPILQQTNETISTVKGTTAFVSQNVINPVSRATGYFAGIRRGIQVLFGDPRNNLPQ